LLTQLTIVENTFLGAELTGGGVLKRRVMEQETRELLKRFELEIDPLMKLADLGVAHRQLVEIAVAVHRKMRFLLLDEPTASLEVGQVNRLSAPKVRFIGLSVVWPKKTVKSWFSSYPVKKRKFSRLQTMSSSSGPELVMVPSMIPRPCGSVTVCYVRSRGTKKIEKPLQDSGG
jgi:hypothetical protein